MNEEQQKLYDVLVRDGYYTKSFEEFQTQFQDSAYQDKVFGVVERDGLFTKGKDSFLEKYAVAEKKKDDTEFVSEVGSSELPAVEGDGLMARHDSLEQTYMDAWKRMQDIQALDEPTNQQIQELQELNTTFTTALNEYNQVADQIRSEAPKSQDPAERVRSLRRGVSRKNEDGGRSTVKMADMEVDGKFVAVPTLFPKDPNNYGPNPEDWVEFGEDDAMGAYEMALERGEVFEFDTPEGAREFAKGSWKEMEEEPPKDEFNKSLEFVNNRLIDRSDAGQVARELEYEFGEFGFNFDRGFEAGIGNYITVTAANGETIDVNTNPQFLTDEDTQADLLRDFLVKNRGTTPKREVEQSIDLGQKELDRLKGVYEQTHGDYERAAAKVEEYRQKVQADESVYDEAEAKRLVEAVNAAAQADQKAVDEYNAVLNIQNAEIDELNRIAQEKRDEPDAFERAFGKNAVTDLIADNTYRPIIQGQAQAGTIRSSYDLLTNANDVTDEDIADFLRAQEVLEEYGPSDEMRDFQRIYQEEGGGWGGFVSAFGKRPPPLGELFVSSVSMMANKEVAKGALLAGAAAAPAGLAGGPLSAVSVPAAFLTGAMGGAGATLEAGISFAEFLRDEMAEKQGVDPEKVVMNNENIREVLSDPEAMSRIRYRAGGRGIAIGVTSLIGTGVAAAATRRTAIKTGSKLKAAATGAAVELPFEGLGETAGQLVAGQELDAAEIGLEALAGGPAQVVGVGIGLFKTPEYTLNGELVTGKQMADFIREADEADVAGATIEIKNDDTLAKQAHTKRDDARERVVIKEQLRKSGVENEETVDKLADLELEKRKLKGLETTAAERKKTRIQNEIDAILDGDSYFFEETTDEQGNKRSKEVRVTRRDAILALLEDDIVNPTEKEIEAKQAELFRDALADIQESDAVQESSTEEVDVGEQAADGEEVGVGDTEEQAVAEEEAVVDEEAEELEAAFEAESTPDVEEDIDGVTVRRREGYEFGRKAQRVLDQAKKRVKALENFGVKIVLHENDAQFGAATNSTGRGLYDSGTKTIHINLDKANSRTVAHEAFHALFLERVKGDDAKAQQWAKATMKSVRKALDADSVLATRIDDFLARYEENVIDEEALAEIFGYLSEGYGELTGPQQSRVKAAIKKLIELFGLKLESQWSQDDQNVIDVLNTLAGKMERGETITEEELAGLDVSEEKAKEVAEETTVDNRVSSLQEKRAAAERKNTTETNLSKLDDAIGRTGDSAAQRVYNKLFKSVGTGKLRAIEKQIREANKSKKMSAEDKEARIDKLEQQYNNELERISKAREKVKSKVEEELKRLEPKIEQAAVKERLAEIREEQAAITKKLDKDKKEAKKVYEGEELKEYVAGLKEEAEAKRAALRDEIAELRGEKKKAEPTVKEEVTPEAEPMVEKPTKRERTGDGEYIIRHRGGDFVIRKTDEGYYVGYQTDNPEDTTDANNFGETFRTIKEAIEYADRDFEKFGGPVEAEPTVTEEATPEAEPTVATIRTKVGVEAFGKLEAAVRKAVEYYDEVRGIQLTEDGKTQNLSDRAKYAALSRKENAVSKLADELGLTDAERAVVLNSVREKIEAEQRAAEAKQAEQAELKAAAERGKQAAEEKEEPPHIVERGKKFYKTKLKVRVSPKKAVYITVAAVNGRVRYYYRAANNKLRVLAREDLVGEDNTETIRAWHIANFQRRIDASLAEIKKRQAEETTVEEEPTVEEKPTPEPTVDDAEVARLEEELRQAEEDLDFYNRDEPDNTKYPKYKSWRQLVAAVRAGKDPRFIEAYVPQRGSLGTESGDGYVVYPAQGFQAPIGTQTIIEESAKRAVAEANATRRATKSNDVSGVGSDLEGAVRQLKSDLAEAKGETSERQRARELNREAIQELRKLKGKTDEASKARRVEIKRFQEDLADMSVEEALAKRAAVDGVTVEEAEKKMSREAAEAKLNVARSEQRKLDALKGKKDKKSVTERKNIKQFIEDLKTMSVEEARAKRQPSAREQRVAANEYDLKSLKKVGEGSTRVVYDLGDGRVLKRAKNPRGLIQNDAIRWGDKNEILLELLPEVYFDEEGADYVIHENVPRNDSAVRKFLKPLKEVYDENRIPGDRYIHPKVMRQMEEMGLGEFLNYDLLMGDFVRPSSWGQRENGEFVLVDDGTLSASAMEYKFGKLLPVSPAYQEAWNEVKSLRSQPKAREQRVDVEAEGPNIVYRSGAVDSKAESRYRMSGGRSTGHFGTGAYFFSDRESAEAYDDRDVTAVDISDYNLAPATYSLHDALAFANMSASRVEFDNQLKQESKPHTITMEEVRLVEAANRIERKRGGINIKRDDNGRRIPVPDLYDVVFDKYYRMMLPTADAKRIAAEATRLYNEPGNIDSASTSIMKALGYEGVNAVGTELDNSTYGTVIYDVKPTPKAREQRVVYHVTPKRNKRGIQSKGIEKGRKAMWSRGGVALAGQRRKGFDTANRSFVFSDLNDALQWAIKTKIEKDTEVSVVAVNAEGKNLQEDTALTQSPFGALSSALYTEDVIAADDILGVQDVTFKNMGKAYDESGNPFTQDSFGLAPKAREQRVADVVERYEFKPNGSLKNASLAGELRRNLKRYGFGVKQFGTRMDDFHIVNLETGRKVDPKKLIAKDRADEKVEMEQRAELRERDAKERMEREEVEEAKARELQEMQDQYVDFPEEMLSAPSRLSPRQQRESLQDNAGKFDDAALVKFAKERGYSDAAILKVRPTAQAAIDAYDARATRLSREVQGIIQKARARARGDKRIQAIENKGQRTRAVNDRIIKDVKAYIQKSKMYEEASDVGREAMMRAVDKQMGRRIKAAPSVIKLLGATPDGDVLIDKKGLLEQIRVMARSSKATAAASREIMREVGKDIARLKATGTISSKQATAILRKMANMDPFNPVQVENFVNYTARVFAEAEYIEEVNKLNKLRKRALKNASKKLGISTDLMPMLQTLLNIDARLVPENVFEKYKELVNDLGERKTVLNLKERTQMFDDVVSIMSGINEELAKKEELFARYEAYTSKADSVKGKIADMVKDEVVTEEEADILNKYADELREERKMSEEEKEKAREEERAKLVDAIQRLPKLDRKFPTQMENKLVRRFNKLVRTEGLLGLSNADLKNVLRVADNIQNGFLPHTAQVLVEQVEVNNRAVVVEQAIKEAKLPNIARIRALLGGVTNNTAIARVVNRNPLRFIDQVYGDYRTTRIYDAAFKDLASSYASYKSDVMGVQQRLDRVEEKLIKSLGRNPNAVIRSKFLIGAYMMQAEFDTNPDVSGVFDAVSLLDETIKKSDRSRGSAYYSPATANVLRDIRKNIDGKSAEEIRALLSEEERAVADEIRSVNDELTPKAEYVAGVLRGVPFRPFSQYFHRIVLTQDDKAGLRGVDALIDEAKTRMRKPSTKAQNIQQRITTSPPAVNFDPFASARRGARYILTDYHMTEAVRTNARLMNKLEATDMTSKQRQFYNAIDNASEATIADALVQSYTISTIGEQAVEMLKRQGYRVVLADMPRMVGELLSNILFVSAAAGRQFAAGIGKHYNTMATNGADVMKNVGSVQTTRLYADSKTISSRMVESIRATTGPEKNDVGQAVFNRAKQIWAYSGAPWGGAVNSLADFMITTPDKIVTRPVWFGTFAEEFKARSGKEVDFDKIAANDEAYMAANEEAIKAATDAADLASVQTGATDNPFLGIVNSFRKSGGTAAGTLIKAINSYMTRFLVFEFVTARTAINASVGNGTITKLQGVKLLSAVLMRMVAYVFITNALRDMLDKALNIDEPEDDDKTLEEEFDEAVFQGIVSLVVGGTYGSVLRGVASTGIEFGRKELMEDAGLDFEYDDSVFIPLISPAQDGRPYKKMTDLLARLSGPYNPIVRPAILAGKLAFDSDKKEVEAIKRRDEEFYRLGLEVLGLMGMVPLYKDVRRLFVKEIYKDLDKDDTPENIEKRIEEELKKLRKEARAK